MRTHTLLALCALALAPGYLSPDAASAQRARAQTTRGQANDNADEPSVPAPTMVDLPAILTRLSTGTPDEIRGALDQLVILDRREGVEPIATLLRAGQPDAITDHALDSLKRIAEPSSIDVLTEFTRHRRPAARRRAYAALAEIQDRRVPALLELGLRDSDRSVRAESATALGRTGSRASVEMLFRAFERGVVEAAPAIGKLGDTASVATFNSHLGRQPLSVMLDGYSEYLHRDDIPEDVKIEIVVRLGEVSGRLVRQFLTQEVGRLSERERSARRRTPSQLLMRMSEVVSRIPTEGDTRRTRTLDEGESVGGTTGGAQ